MEGEQVIKAMWVKFSNLFHWDKIQHAQLICYLNAELWLSLLGFRIDCSNLPHAARGRNRLRLAWREAGSCFPWRRRTAVERCALSYVGNVRLRRSPESPINPGKVAIFVASRCWQKRILTVGGWNIASSSNKGAKLATLNEWNSLHPQGFEHPQSTGHDQQSTKHSNLRIQLNIINSAYKRSVNNILHNRW